MCMALDTVAYGGGAAERALTLPGGGRPLPVFAYGYDGADEDAAAGTRGTAGASGAGEPRPAVIILHDVFGPKPLYRDMGRRLADAGFAALLPDLFVREGPPADDSREAIFARAGRHSFPTALEDIGALAGALRAEGRAVATIGFCMGGTLALLAAGRLPDLAASVVYYGFPVNASPTPNRPDNPIAEVERLRAPVLGFFGEQDAAVGPDNVRRYAAAAAAAGKDVRFTIYPDAGHSYLTFDPAAPAAAPSQESWTRTLEFLRAHLGG